MPKINKSWLTAMHRKNMSVPLRELLKREYLADGTVLDYGCGHGEDVRSLRRLGFETTGFDPHNGSWTKRESIEGNKYDTVLCTYVLNVVDRETRMSIIGDVKKLLKPDGKAYFTVRRNITQEGWTTRQTTQYNVKLNMKKIRENSGYCIYEMLNNGD